MEWSKTARDQWQCEVPPDARFIVKARIKGDGRWTWEVFAGAAENPTASGIVNSLGAAKNASEGFLKRAGYT
jgi:hypothetical protein